VRLDVRVYDTVAGADLVCTELTPYSVLPRGRPPVAPTGGRTAINGFRSSCDKATRGIWWLFRLGTQPGSQHRPPLSYVDRLCDWLIQRFIVWSIRCLSDCLGGICVINRWRCNSAVVGNAHPTFCRLGDRRWPLVDALRKTDSARRSEPGRVGTAHHCLVSVASVIGLFNVASLDRSGGYPMLGWDLCHKPMML